MSAPKTSFIHFTPFILFLLLCFLLCVFIATWLSVFVCIDRHIPLLWINLKFCKILWQVKLDDCSKFILEVSDNQETGYLITQKRKYQCAPGSPNGVIDSYFSSDNSCDSWAVTSSVSSSPEPVLKKMRAQNQQMRLAPVSCVSLNDNR